MKFRPLLFLVLLGLVSCFGFTSSFQQVSLAESASSGPVSEPGFEVPTVETDEGTWWAITGHYANTNYPLGYSIRIPKGMTAWGALPPAPNHGFLLRLDKAAQAKIWVDVSYAAADNVQNVDDAIDESIEFCREQATGLVVVKRTSFTWFGLPARHAVVRYVDTATGETRICDMRLVMEPKEFETDCPAYLSLTLDTRQARYQSDRKTLMQLYRSWRLLPTESEDESEFCAA